MSEFDAWELYSQKEVLSVTLDSGTISVYWTRDFIDAEKFEAKIQNAVLAGKLEGSVQYRVRGDDVWSDAIPVDKYDQIRDGHYAGSYVRYVVHRAAFSDWLTGNELIVPEGSPLNDWLGNQRNTTLHKDKSGVNQQPQNIEQQAESEWSHLSPPKNSAEFASLCYEVVNDLQRVPRREGLTRELVRRFGKSHDIKASNRTGESLTYGVTVYTHNALTKVIARINKRRGSLLQ